MSKEVLLGFSGGIDSRASVAILQQQGYRVTALTLDTTGDRRLIDTAVARAAELGVELVVDDVRESFEHEVIDYFVDSYMRGETPAPCTLCNPRIKWRRLEQVADSRGIDYIATGHYFQVTERDGKKYVTRGVDAVKDQSYYLWGLPQRILNRIVTPMGNRLKSDMRQMLGEAPLSRESMGVCFLGGRSYGELIRERTGLNVGAGDVVDAQGVVVGRHSGFPYYTTGQKRGFEMFEKRADCCVIEIDAANNRLMVGVDNDLYHNNLIVFDCNIVDIDELTGSDDISVKIRGLGRNPDGFARITPCDTDLDTDSTTVSIANTECATNAPKAMSLHVTLDSAAWAAAKGQPVVFYRGERVVGGGFLKKYF